MRRVIKNYNSLLIELVEAKPIAFNPMLAKAAGSASAGLFLSQLLFWWGKGNLSSRGWIYKTIKEVQEETYLTRSEQDAAIRKWKELGVLDIQLIGLPRRRHFHINEEKLIQLLERISGHTLVRASTSKRAGFSTLAGKPQHANTENTQENTNIDSSKQEGRSAFLETKNAGRSANYDGIPF